MKVLLCAGYPKSGNTMLAQALDIAASIESEGHPPQPWDFYQIKKKNLLPISNPYLFDAAHIKTHERFKNKDVDYGDKSLVTDKVVVIIRNPFDTLLSSLNYLRVIVKENNRIPTSVQSTIQKLLPSYVLPSSPDQFIEKFNIDTLLHQDLLDSCLSFFGRNGTVFDQFYSMSGPWVLFSLSYLKTPLPVHVVRYEDIISSPNFIDSGVRSKTIFMLADFLGSDRDTLLKAFDIQSANVASQKSRGAMFFPKAEAGYFVDYFSRSAVSSFTDMYFSVLKDFGYHELYNLYSQ